MGLRLIAFLMLVELSNPAPGQWQRQNSGTDANFRGICAVSDKVAWASGSKGTVLRTVDGGTTWQKVSVAGAEKLDFRDVQAFDARDAFVLSIGPGELSRIYKTVDGGKSWKLQFTNPTPKAFFDAFAFWDRKHGIAVSDSVDGSFPLIVTHDGETWKPLSPAALPAALPNEGCFAASGTCIEVGWSSNVWFVTSAARVFRSTDGGLNWGVAALPLLHDRPSQGTFSIGFIHGDGVIVGGDYERPEGRENNIAFTLDFGVTWAPPVTVPPGFRSAVAGFPSSSGTVWIAVGTNGSDYSRDRGRTWHPLDKGNYNAVSFASSGAGWAVGPKGMIARFQGIARR